jgi:hypothetical protein
MKRSRKRKPTAPAITDAQWMSSGYDGANVSVRRGQIFWPSMDTRLELDTFSRRELMRRIRWLCANVGFVRGLVKNSGTLVGWLTPHARSGDRTWNREAERRFKSWGNRAITFDRSGKYNFESAQLMLTRNSKRDGDVFTVLTTSRDGRRPMVAFYEAHSLANPEKSGPEWFDGVKIDPTSGTHTHYGFLGPNGKVKVVPASAVIYYGEFESPGHGRAVPPLAHAVNHAIDITEVRADTKHNIKTAALFGVVREVEKGAPATKASRGIGGSLSELRRVNSEGTESRFESRDVWGGGQMPDLPPGHKLNVVHDDRPSPNQTAFMDELIRDISIGFGLPPEVVWKMGSLNGPGVRFVMDYAARWIEKEQARLWDWAERVWWYFLGFETRQGLGFPAEGDWLAIHWIPQRDLTIDRGREGKQRMDEISRGIGTMGDWHKSMSGASGEEKIMERIDEVKFGMEYAETQGVPYDRAFPPAAGATYQVNPEEEAPEEEPEPEDPPSS